MVQTYLIGIGGFVLLAVLWVVIQSWWRQTFAEHLTEEDVLAGRTKCSNCGCTTVCENKNQPLSTQ